MRTGQLLPQLFSKPANGRPSARRLENGSRVAVMGGGPAGSFFSYFLLDLAERLGMELKVDIYEPRDFSLPAPQGCNMCAGVISETLVQNLAAEGINLPDSVVLRAINSYVLHSDLGSQRLDAVSREKRIAATFRGGGPRGIREVKFLSLDAHLLSLARSKGATVVPSRVTGVERIDECLLIKSREGIREYDLLVVAAGVNTAALKLFEEIDSKYVPPKTTKTAIRDYSLNREISDQYFGDSLHVFLLDIPRLDFAMIVPKNDYVSVCMLGKDIDDNLIEAFLTHPVVKSCFPEGWRWNEPDCQCLPRMNIQAAIKPYGNRIVFIGDSGVSRLYKDGIGTAYKAAKAAATCALLQGISADDFKRFYAPFCRNLDLDNHFGRLIFLVTHIFQHVRFARKAMLEMVAAEQLSLGLSPRMSSVLWDTFTGSAPYKDVFFHTLHPAFLSRFAWGLVRSTIGS